MSKVSNSIVVGGPIAVGKSSLVGALPFIPVQELDPNDELQLLLIEKMYEGDPIAPQIFQLDMLLTRFDKYKKMANDPEAHVFDRSIFEDKYFAKNLLKNYPNIWNYYHSIWKDKVEELLKEIGLPKHYLLLTCDWKTFKERVFERNRLPEIENFEANESYFKDMIDNYEKFMKDIFKEYGIEYTVLNTNNLGKLEVIDEAKKILKEKGFL